MIQSLKIKKVTKMLRVFMESQLTIVQISLLVSLVSIFRFYGCVFGDQIKCLIEYLSFYENQRNSLTCNEVLYGGREICETFRIFSQVVLTRTKRTSEVVRRVRAKFKIQQVLIKRTKVQYFRLKPSLAGLTRSIADSLLPLPL